MSILIYTRLFFFCMLILYNYFFLLNQAMGALSKVECFADEPVTQLCHDEVFWGLLKVWRHY